MEFIRHAMIYYVADSILAVAMFVRSKNKGEEEKYILSPPKFFGPDDDDWVEEFLEKYPDKMTFVFAELEPKMMMPGVEPSEFTVSTIGEFSFGIGSFGKSNESDFEFGGQFIQAIYKKYGPKSFLKTTTELYEQMMDHSMKTEIGGIDERIGS